MQRAFRALVLVAAGGLSPSACIDLEPPPSTGGTVSDDGSPTAGVDETGCEGEACAHGMSGELLLFVNGRLSSADALYQNNLPLSEAGTYIGPSLWLYDPTRECDDGSNGCRLAELGHLRLDESLGELSVGDGALAKFTLRELAWSPDAGLMAVTFDVKNDEWGLARLHVDDWTSIDNEIGVERYTLLPGDAASASTDPCYWQEGVSGLEFLGSELFLGVRGMGGSGIPSNGAVFRIALDVLDQGHCVYENDVTNDPAYYACDVLCLPWAELQPQLGIAGDLAPDLEGMDLLGMVRAENEEIMPLDRQELYRIVAPAEGETVSVPVSEGIVADGIVPGVDIDGLARIEGVLYGIDVLGKVYRIDEDARTVTEHDDLGPRFPDHELSLRVRGATRVVVEGG